MSRPTKTPVKRPAKKPAKAKAPAKKAKPAKRARQPKKVLHSAATPLAPESVEALPVGALPTSTGALPRAKKHRAVSPAVKAAVERAEARARGEDPWEKDVDDPALDPLVKEYVKARAGVASPKAKAAKKKTVATSAVTGTEPEHVEKIHEIERRPTEYKPEYCNVARQLCEQGATDDELAEFFNVSRMTIWRWKSKHLEFRYALHVGKTQPDKEVERGLYHRARGYTYETEKLFCHKGEIVRATVVEHMPPDPGAAKIWLGNRDPENWTDPDKRKGTEDLNTGGMVVLEMARAVAYLLSQGMAAQQQQGQLVDVSPA